MMNTKYKLIGFLILFIIAIISVALITENKQQLKESIIFTAVPSSQLVHSKFPEGSKIFSFDKIAAEPVDITQKFYSARSPEVSFDGMKMLFTAQMNKGDLWQIWEMDLQKLSTRQITNRSLSCTDPAYLPNGQIVFSSPTLKIQNVPGVMALYTIDKDGTNEKQITFHPNNDQNPTILPDGRILINTQQVYPDRGKNYQLVLRPDGTKAKLFYKPRHGHDLISRGWDTENGRYVYVEKPEVGASRVMTINQNRPLYSETDISPLYPGEFYSVFPDHHEEYLVSYQQYPQQNFSLYKMKTQAPPELELIYSNSEYHVIEPVITRTRSRPKNLPSRIEEGDENGTILCMDANISQDEPSGTKRSTGTFAVEVLGLNNSIGIVPLAADGSFYIEVPSNTPLRFQTYDNSEQLIRGPSAWIWVRPKERRGCIGCHENKELAPENRVPLAVEKQIVNLAANNDKAMAQGSGNTGE